MTDTEEPTVSGAVITHAGRVLMIRRSIPVGGLLWTFPAGKVEPGETVDQAAVREALEEAGVTVEPMRPLGERVHPDTGRTVAYMACRLLGGEARVASAREVAEVAWVRLGEIPELVPGGLFKPVQAYLNAVLTD